MNYTPDFNRKNTKERTQRALKFVQWYLRAGEVKPVAQTQINLHFGWTGRPLGQWLKQQLLICTDSYYNHLTGTCKKYMRNTEGYQELLARLRLTEQDLLADNELELDLDQVAYTEKSQRLYHPLQNLPKRVKRRVFKQSGLNYEYDIDSASQRLLLQLARQQGLDKATPLLDQLLENRDLVRDALCRDLMLDKDQMKRILHSILNGGAVSSWHTNQIFALVNYRKEKILEINQHPLIEQYKQEVRWLWASIKPSMNLLPGTRLTSRLRAEQYRLVEESVRKQIEKYLKKTKNRYFLEHDGWSCETAVDIEELISEVKRATGFTIKLNWTIYEDIS